MAPNPPEGAELNANGEGAADGADVEAAVGAADPKPKDGGAAAAAAGAAAALAGTPKIKG